jgi:UDPglucose 6-dehydrogenase
MGRLKNILPSRLVVDLRNIYPADEMARHGFTYLSIGRPETSNRQ